MTLDQLDIITSELENTSVVNDGLIQQVEITNVNIEKIAAKLEVATDQRVPPAHRHQCDEVFAIYHNPTTSRFYMIRWQKRTIAAVYIIV
jgi:hypothetical protein